MEWQHIKIQRLLQHGAFGAVYQAEDVTGTKLAVKVVRVENEKDQARFLRESTIARELSPYSNIITTLGVFQKDSRGILIMNYVEKDLASILSEQILSENEVQRYFRQICKAVEILHSKEIVHLDIKPENILIDKDKKVQLCDFGYAQKISTINYSKLTIFGTEFYHPPEIKRGIRENIDLYKVDIWSLGHQNQREQENWSQAVYFWILILFGIPCGRHYLLVGL